jgi:arylsulfatase A-like enzyme
MPRAAAHRATHRATQRAACALALLAAVAGVVAGCQLPTQRGRWNVLVILVDTQRADSLGAYGYGSPTSPHFDQLAAGSHLFTAARAQAPCTFPSANSLLTSRYAQRFLGQPDRAIGIPAEIPSLAEMLAPRGWATAAVSASPVVRATPGKQNPGGGFGRGFATFDEECEWRDGACVTKAALTALDGLQEPFFLYLHYLDPHGPYNPPRDLRARFVTASSPHRWVRRGNPNPIADMLYKQGPAVEYSPEDLRFLRQLYDAEVAAFDRQLGILLGELRERGLLDRTVVALVADHGESFLEHAGVIKHCRSLYDSELHTPFLLRLPRQHEGSRITAQVQNLDLVPTLLDLLGEPLEGRGLEGRSLVPLLEGRAAGREGGEAGEARLAYAMMSSLRSVSDGRYKLIHDLRAHSWQLFDLTADPGELHDVAKRERRVFAHLRAELLTWLAAVEDEQGLERSEEAEERLKALGYL